MVTLFAGMLFGITFFSLMVYFMFLSLVKRVGAKLFTPVDAVEIEKLDVG